MHAYAQFTPDRVWRARFSSLAAPEVHRAMGELVKPNPAASAAVDARLEVDLKLGIVISRLLTRALRDAARASLRLPQLQLVPYGVGMMAALSLCVDRAREVSRHQPAKSIDVFATVYLRPASSVQVACPRPAHSSLLCRLLPADLPALPTPTCPLLPPRPPACPRASLPPSSSVLPSVLGASPPPFGRSLTGRRPASVFGQHGTHGRPASPRRGRALSPPPSARGEAATASFAASAQSVATAASAVTDATSRSAVQKASAEARLRTARGQAEPTRHFQLAWSGGPTRNKQAALKARDAIRTSRARSRVRRP